MKYYAVITGASSGLGTEFARTFAEKGLNLFIVARRRERLIELAAEIKSRYGVEVEIMTADLSVREERDSVLARTAELPVAVFVNNAGFGDCGVFTETDLDKDLSMIDVNVSAVHHLAKGILRQFNRQGKGYLLNVASSAGLLPGGPYMATYYATKAYVTSLTRAIARELKESGSRIYVGALCPGPVDTEFNSVADVEFALPGISAGYCVRYAVRRMLRRQTIIVPTLRMKIAVTAGRIISPAAAVAITGRQQKRKMDDLLPET
jgi:short-subunit dehydrogenase